MNSEEKNSFDYWDSFHQFYNREHIKTDDWLLKFDDLIKNCTTPILDLGCGSGNDTLYLIEQGKTVIPCDQSPNAIKNIKRNFPEVQDARCFNLIDGLPFVSNSYDIIVADLCLHYFRETDTFRILNEILDKLTDHGHLLLRVNTIHDVNHGAGQGIELEPHLYRTKEGTLKRFFDETDMNHFFQNFDLQYCVEEKMTRYSSEKIVFCASAMKRASSLTR